MADRDIARFGSGERQKQQITLDWPVFAGELSRRLGITEEEIETRGIKAQVLEIMDNPNLSPAQKEREIEYLTGRRKKRGAKLTDAEKKARNKERREQKKLEKLAESGLFGISKTTVTRPKRTTEESLADKLAQGRSRGAFARRNKQVLTHMLPGLHGRFLDVDVEGRTKRASAKTKEALQALRNEKDERGRSIWEEMNVAAAVDALVNLGFPKKDALGTAQRFLVRREKNK